MISYANQAGAAALWIVTAAPQFAGSRTGQMGLRSNQ